MLLNISPSNAYTRNTNSKIYHTKENIEHVPGSRDYEQLEIKAKEMGA